MEQCVTSTTGLCRAQTVLLRRNRIQVLSGNSRMPPRVRTKLICHKKVLSGRSVDDFQFLERLNRFMDGDLRSKIDQDELAAGLLQLAQTFVARDKVRLK